MPHQKLVVVPIQKLFFHAFSR